MTGDAPALKMSTKLLYGFGTVAYGVKDIAFRSFLLIYYNQVIGVRADLVSAAILVALLIDAISDPIVGQLSDSLRTRWGRRHPLMYASAIPAAGSFLMLWLPPAGLSDLQMFFYILFVGSAVRTLITFYEIPSSALAAELTSDYDERTAIASYRYFFGTAGGFLLAFVTLRYFLQPTEDYPIGQLNPMGYEIFGLAGAGLMIISILISALGTHHRIRYLRKSPPPQGLGVIGILRQMGQSYSHSGFLSILAFGILKYTSIGMSAALLLYFGTYFWEFSAGELGILIIDAFVAAFLSLLVAPWVSRKMGKRNAAFILAFVAITAAVTPYALRLSGLFWPNGHPLLLPTYFCLQTVYYTCGISSAVLVHAMIGDVVEDSALRTGRRTEGLFYSANTFMQKSVSGLGLVVAGAMLIWVGFPEGADPETLDPKIVTTLATLYIPAMITLYFGGAFFLFFYRIDRAGHAANVAKLRAQDDPLAEE